MKYTVAVAQMDTGSDVAENLRRIECFAREAAGKDAKLVVFPERADYMGRDLRSHAQAVPGEFSGRLASLARELNIHILCGMSESASTKTGNPYNTALLMGAEGKLLAQYRKLHLFQMEGAGVSVDEHRFTAAGREVVVADTPLGRMGMSICYDLRFPELYRKMALDGAEILTVPADFTYETGKDHWRTLLCARAIENCCYVVAANQCGQKPRYRAYGHSMIIDPWGRVLAEAGEEEALIYGEIRSDVMDEVRRQMPSLGNVRKDIF